jgi:hypothetical protein
MRGKESNNKSRQEEKGGEARRRRAKVEKVAEKILNSRGGRQKKSVFDWGGGDCKPIYNPQPLCI